MTWEQWYAAARKAGEFFWCYADFIDDNPDGAKAAWKRGETAEAYIREEGERLDLHRFGAYWGFAG